MVGLLAGTGVAAAAPAAVGAAAPTASGPVGGRGDGGAGQIPEKPGSPATPPEHATPLTAPEAKAAPPVPPDAGPGLAPTAYRHYYTYYGPTNVPSGAIWEAWVHCPSGMVATGGGEYNNNPGGVVLTASGPIGDGWRVEVWNRSSVASTFTVYAVCMTGITDYQVVTGSASNVPAGQINSVIAACPWGHQYFSGGFRADTAAIEATSTRSVAGGGWETQLRNKSSASTTAVGQVVCGNGLNGFNAFVVSTPVAIGPGGYASATVTCPNGTYAVGGGVWEDPIGNLAITDSYPISNYAWRVYARNDAAATTMWALAICGS